MYLDAVYGLHTLHSMQGINHSTYIKKSFTISCHQKVKVKMLWITLNASTVLDTFFSLCYNELNDSFVDVTVHCILIVSLPFISKYFNSRSYLLTRLRGNFMVSISFFISVVQLIVDTINLVASNPTVHRIFIDIAYWVEYVACTKLSFYTT